ncbi:afadin- and alpha-actinin-binding protein isoform X2 [Orussus abietinus]|uniref:afadin- and alpha-actinin-binding protein isoform X2 n=1 Tax=Orussus abietinus TaxID=222816 RepID=UPI000626D3AF|nr:afadin- and alpha-actinin-binding protein isoform X2 [Orussus abietinus]
MALREDTNLRWLKLMAGYEPDVQELESFGLPSVTPKNDEIQSVGSLKLILVTLINAVWNFIREHRGLMSIHDQLKDIHQKVANDNVHLKNNVKRLKEELEKKVVLLHETRERERRLIVQRDSMSRDLKHGKDEVAKLWKQLQSKENQHAHELRRIQQSGQKLQQQLQKSVGTYVPKDKAWKNLHEEHKKELALYRQTICHLEENNRLMLQEINELREALSVQSGGIDLDIEASGIWNDAET